MLFTTVLFTASPGSNTPPLPNVIALQIASGDGLPPAEIEIL